MLILYIFALVYTISSHPAEGFGNSFGKLFKVSTYGESHGKGVGVVIDGCPPRIPLNIEDIQVELDRRKPGQSRLTTPRQEDDLAEILSGMEQGLTTGMPISILIRNKDHRSNDYDELSSKYRPSHADATYDFKYGIRSVAGGGRSSARETIGRYALPNHKNDLDLAILCRVAAGAVAKKVLKLFCNVEIIGYVLKVQDISATVDPNSVTLEQVRSFLHLFDII